MSQTRTWPHPEFVTSSGKLAIILNNPNMIPIPIARATPIVGTLQTGACEGHKSGYRSTSKLLSNQLQSFVTTKGCIHLASAIQEEHSKLPRNAVYVTPAAKGWILLTA